MTTHLTGIVTPVRKTCAILFLLGALLIIAAHPAIAQVSPPTSANPAIIDQRFQPSAPAEQAAPALPATPPAPAAVSSELLRKHPKPFTLENVRVEDVTVYPAGTFESLYKNKVGQKVSLDDVREMAREITNRYRADGYVLSQAVVPNQNYDGGVKRIPVVEGYINKVTVDNSRPESDRRHLIDAYGKKIGDMRPLNTKDLERYMLLINDLPGVSARAVIHPSATAFGAADLIIEVHDKVWEGSFTSDNRGNKYLGPWQEQATLTENSLAGFDERTTIRGINTIPTRDLHFFDVQHEEQLDTEGTRLILLYSDTLTRPGDTLKSLDLSGSSNDYNLTVTHPFIRSRAMNFTARVVAEGRDTENDAFGNVITNERTRTLRLGGNFNIADKLSGTDAADAQVSQGTSWFDATEEGIAHRSGTDMEFTKGNLDLSRIQNLPYGFSVLTAATGQYSSQELPVSEQFVLGGVGFGQAYDNGEIAGDSGLAGKVELRYGQQLGYQYFDSYQLYGYYDIGSIYINDAASGVNNQLSLASAGVGVRSNFTQNLYGYLEVGFPLTRDVASEGNKDPRLFFSVTGRF